MVCLRKPEADPTRNHLPLWRYPAQQGLKLNDDDDDDEEEEEEKDDDDEKEKDDNHHQGMGCHCSALCLQRQVIYFSWFLVGL